MHKRKLWSLLLGATIALLVLAACGAPAPAEEEPVEEAAPVEEEEEMMAEPSVAVLDDSGLGQRLVDGNGITLYLFTVDEPDVSNCNDGCANNWPPLLTVAGVAPSVEGAPAGTFGVITRQDDTQQITFNTMPLYYFAGDANPGDTNGQGLGSVWFVASSNPAVVVSDQPVVNVTVIIDRVLAAEPGWMVIHAEGDGGGPGAVIGWAPVSVGLNNNVAVEIDTSAATDTLYAMLHLDVGAAGEYEFPGDDAPYIVDGAPITPPFNTAVDPSVTVADQALKDGTVTIAEAIMLEDGWMVIHAEADDGGPGAVIGHAPLSAGINRKVVVEIDTSAATDTLYAMLHLDVGAAGEYEFPGDDAPVIVDGAPVTPPFSVTE